MYTVSMGLNASPRPWAWNRVISTLIHVKQVDRLCWKRETLNEERLASSERTERAAFSPTPRLCQCIPHETIHRLPSELLVMPKLASSPCAVRSCRHSFQPSAWRCPSLAHGRLFNSSSHSHAILDEPGLPPRALPLPSPSPTFFSQNSHRRQLNAADGNGSAYGDRKPPDDRVIKLGNSKEDGDCVLSLLMTSSN